MKVDTPCAVEACVEFAKYLNAQGLDPDNYPLFLELLRDENRYVVEALVGREKAFDLFTRVQPNPYIVGFCFQIAARVRPGGVNDLTLEMIFGILYRSYHSAKEGHALHALSIEDVNAVGKFLDKTRDQNDPINSFILDILADIAESPRSTTRTPSVDKNSAHATAIRNAFFDRKRAMSSVMPPEILAQKQLRRDSREAAEHAEVHGNREEGEIGGEPMAQLDEFNKEVWSDQSIFRVENHIINNIFACRTTDAVEAAITYSAFLRKSGLTNENYPLFCKLLEMDNHFVIDSLLGTTDPFLFLTPDPAHQAPGFHVLPAAHQLAPGRDLSEDPRHRAGRPAVRATATPRTATGSTRCPSTT